MSVTLKEEWKAAVMGEERIEWMSVRMEGGSNVKVSSV